MLQNVTKVRKRVQQRFRGFPAAKTANVAPSDSDTPLHLTFNTHIATLQNKLLKRGGGYPHLGR